MERALKILSVTLFPLLFVAILINQHGFYPLAHSNANAIVYNIELSRSINISKNTLPQFPMMPASTIYPPRVIVQILPNYPAEAILNNQQGIVLLSLFVNEQGLVTEANVYRSSGYNELDNAAINATKLWKFEPATKDNQKISAKINLPINFAIKEKD